MQALQVRWGRTTAANLKYVVVYFLHLSHKQCCQTVFELDQVQSHRPRETLQRNKKNGRYKVMRLSYHLGKESSEWPYQFNVVFIPKLSTFVRHCMNWDGQTAKNPGWLWKESTVLHNELFEPQCNQYWNSERYARNSRRLIEKQSEKASLL